MLKFRFNIFLTFFAFVFLFPLEGHAINKVKTVVLFFSWNVSLPAYQVMLDGIKSTFNEENGETYNLQIEYLDINRLQDRAYAKSIVDLYNEKYSETHIDLLILIGPWTYPVLKAYGLKALDYAPTISVDNDNLISNSGNYSSNENVLKINLTYNFTKSLKTSFDLFPNNNTVYVISGCSSVDVYYASLVRKAAEDLKDTHHFIFITGISMDSTLQIVEKIPKNSIVLIPIYVSDAKGIPFSTPEATSIIASHCKAPVFPITDTFIKKKGAIGGYVFSYTYVGKEIGKAARQILSGRSAPDIIIDDKGFYQYIFDWQQLKNWDLLNSSVIPSESLFFNQDLSFVSKYKWYLVGLILFLVSQTLLILYLFRLNQRQKELAKQKIETEILYRELIRQDRMAKMSELTASLSHELNQPLTAILYNAQAGLRFLKSDNLDQEQAKEIFENIIDDDKRAGGIISSVKSLMRLETREMENVDLNSLIHETINLIHSDAIKNGIKIGVRLESGPVFVFGDKIQLQQVLMNLMRNATVAMQSNEAENRIMEIILQVNKGSAIVSVRDSGPGIDATVKGKLFKPFFTTSKNGSGIGLALSKSILMKHNGDIWAENLTSKGAEFSFSLQIV